ncbi:MAG: hypothetical protein R3B57_08330 [Phycisphaerales bacterium]
MPLARRPIPRPFLVAVGVLALIVIHTIARIGAPIAVGLGHVAPPAETATQPATQPATRATPDPEQSLILLAAVVLVGAIEAATIAAFTLRARSRIVPLCAALAIIIFGVMSLQAQVESAYFGVLPLATIRDILLMGAIIACVTSLAAVALLPRLHGPRPSLRLALASRTPWSWVWRAIVASLAYVAIYLIFGYFIAWQDPAVRDYYHGEAPVSFLAHLSDLATSSPDFFALQAARGLVWTAIGVLAIATLRRGRAESALLLALLFAVLLNAQLLIPNPTMPWEVRRMHILETVPSNLLMGALVGLLFAGRPASRGGPRVASDPVVE